MLALLKADAVLPLRQNSAWIHFRMEAGMPVPISLALWSSVGGYSHDLPGSFLVAILLLSLISWLSLPFFLLFQALWK